VSELIHKSDGFPDLEYCRVSVHFVDIVDTPTDDDHYTEVPGTELVVTRIAYKNNTSKCVMPSAPSPEVLLPPAAAAPFDFARPFVDLTFGLALGTWWTARRRPLPT
jgi:hypothetical protein